MKIKREWDRVINNLQLEGIPNSVYPLVDSKFLFIVKGET